MPATMPGLMTIRAALRRAAGRPRGLAGVAALYIVERAGPGRAGLAASGHRVARLLVAHGVWGWLPVWLSWPAVARTATASSTPRTAVAVSGIV
jgi:hypothetical protein